MRKPFKNGVSAEKKVVRNKFNVGDLVKKANEVSCKDLIGNITGDIQGVIECCCCNFKFDCCLSDDLSQEKKENVFNIMETNMKDIYLKSSWGWDAEKKRQELFAPESRFLICYLKDKNTTCLAGLHGSGCNEICPNKPCGFVHFRFEADNQRPCLYVYEIQLIEKARGLRMGQTLMEFLFKIASTNSMTRLLLTVFKFNSHAYNFFSKIGFKVDSTDPYNYGKHKDYSIMYIKI